MGRPDWETIEFSESFLDILGENGPPPRHQTRFQAAWTEDALWIRAELEEPDLWATLEERDCVIFHDNDIEVFLDPDGDGELYLEIEVNALGTVWDLLLDKRYDHGGKALDSFDVKGLEVQVELDGTLNDPTDRDKGWTCEVKIPWRSLKEISRGISVPPRPGDTWKLNLSRVQWDLEVRGGKYFKIEDRPEHNWVWSPMTKVDMHQPQEWGLLIFE